MLLKDLSLINEANEDFSTENHLKFKLDEHEWKALTNKYYKKITNLAQSIYNSLDFELKNIHLKKSKEEYVTTRTQGVSIGTLRLRSENSYYEQLNIPIPAPENPSGPHATGISLEVSLHAPFETIKGFNESQICIELNIWGSRERTAFSEMLADHKRIFHHLLRGMPFDFHTSCVFENLENHKDKDIYDLLNLYYENINDDENCFTIGQSFGIDSKTTDIVNTFTRLFLLYDGLTCYLQPRTDKDELLYFASYILRGLKR